MSSIFGTGFGQQQQQQQPPQQNAFGSFGGSGFGTFGQNPQQQPQQPQTNPMFGNLASSSSNPSGGFGAFASNTTSAFGQPKPAFGQPTAGAGTFGQPSAFGNTATGGGFGSGSGGGFGASASGGNVFGQPAAQQQSTTFGSGGGLFGKPSGSAFGSTALVPTLPTAGSSNPPFQEFQERDSSGGNLSTMLHYQSISCMPAYRNVSFEELRVQDYQQGRKNANAFGSTAPFGQPAQQQPSGIFGQPSTTTAPSGAFGQPQPPTGSFNAFGQQQQQPVTFGSFGQPQQQTTGGFGAFGQQNQQQQPPTGGTFGTFGQQNQPSTFGGFGQQTQPNKPFGSFGQPQPSASGFGTFGSNTGAGTAPSVFGQPQQQQNPSPFGTFGQQQQQQQNNQPSLLKPSVFSQPSGGSSGLFGSANQGTGGLFGQPAGGQQQQAGSIFGQSSNGAGVFGPPTQPTQQPSIFSQPSSTPPSGNIFGAATQPQNQQQQQPSSGFSSLFSKPPGGGLFGSTPSTQPQTQTQTNQPQQQNPNPTNPLFGGGGLFGNTAPQQQPQGGTTNTLFGGGLFSNKPAMPPTASGGLFGNTTPQQQQSAGGGLFGSANLSQPQQSSVFGASAQPQQNLTASIDQPLPTTLPSLPPLAASLSPPKKKSNVFAHIPSPRLGLGSIGLNYTPPGPGSKLRGFGSGTATTTQFATMQNPFTASLSVSTSPAKSGGNILSQDAFVGRQSVKKLVLDKRIEEAELHRMRTSAGAEVRFSPALGVASREKEHESAARHPTSRPTDATNVSPTPGTLAATKDGGNNGVTPLDPQEGEYWCLPPVADLQRLSFGELQTVENFTVGRVGFGTIQFLAPVDLTAVPAIADVPGKIVVFEHAECILYPDERLRPPKGEGLNVPARIKLDRCWAIDRATREPIKDSNDPKHVQRLKKMKSHEGAEFVSFDMETGVWEFIVQEF